MSDQVSMPPTFRLGYFALPAEDLEQLRQWVEVAQSTLPIRVELVRKGPFSAITTDVDSLLVPQRVAQLQKIGCPVLLVAQQDSSGAVHASVRQAMPQAIVLPRPLSPEVLAVCIKALAPISRVAPEVQLACLSALPPLIRAVSRGAASALEGKDAGILRDEQAASQVKQAAFLQKLVASYDDNVRSTMMGILPDGFGLQTDMGTLPSAEDAPRNEMPLQPPLLSAEALKELSDIFAKNTAEPEPEPEPEGFKANSLFEFEIQSLANTEQLANSAWPQETMAEIAAEAEAKSQQTEQSLDATDSALHEQRLEMQKARAPVLEEAVEPSLAVVVPTDAAPAHPQDSKASLRYQRLVRAVADWNSAGVKVDTMARYKLKSWPSPEWLQEDAFRVRVATLLAQKSLMLNEVASATGASWVQCQACLSSLLAAGLLQRQSKNAALQSSMKSDGDS